jgi:hypothetical protein
MTDDAKTRRYQPRRKTWEERYKVCEMTVHRWERDPKLAFPTPLEINGKKYDDIDLLDEWDRQQFRAALRRRGKRCKARNPDRVQAR